MRIVHFSDIHLSASNYDDFRNDFLRALISDLKTQSANGEFELIIITGDLVDCGGDSLYEITQYIGREDEIGPFDIFRELFIDPIAEALNIPKSKFLFVPGNHDIDESGILLKEESIIVKRINDGGNSIADKMLSDNDKNFQHSKRIQRFKQFEENFHGTTNNYKYTNNQSTYIHNAKDGNKYGFILLNDSWRCKSDRLQIEHADFGLNLGVNQLHEGLRVLETHDTDVNICLMHHPVDDFNEKDVIEDFFFEKRIDLVLLGDRHKNKFRSLNAGPSSYIALQCRATFNNQNESDINYMCGYQILDLGKNQLYSITNRLYFGCSGRKRFIPDVLVNDDGINRNKVYGNIGFPFLREQSLEQLDKSNFKN